MAKKNRTKSKAQNRLAKKEAVLGKPRKSSANGLKLITFAGIILVFGGLFLFYHLQSGATAPVNTPPGVSVSSDAVTFPVNMFADGKARHFEMRNGDMTIRYFILKSSDGVVRAAFDACDVCWPAGKGYYQEGDVMVCRNCGRRFASVLVNEVKGGCNPAPLRRTLQGDKLVIAVKDILEGRQYFDFSKRG